ERTAKRDHRRSAGRMPRDFDRIFNRLRPGRQKNRFLGRSARHHLIEPLSQPHVRLVRGDLKARVSESLQLPFDRRNDAVMTMTDVEYANATRKVDIATPFDIAYLGILRRRSKHGKRDADTARNSGLQTAPE